MRGVGKKSSESTEKIDKALPPLLINHGCKLNLPEISGYYYSKINILRKLFRAHSLTRPRNQRLCLKIAFFG